ncbi:MAG: Type IV fimbrial assembly, ATPase PilB, partial [uncultured Rubrobacteraceae bacterium]
RQGLGRHGSRQARDARPGGPPLPRGVQPGLRRRARHGPDGLGQVDVAVRGARRAQLGREEHHHDRGPRRVPAQRRHPGPGQPARRPDVRHGPEVHDACRPGHHHGRRDPRPRGRADRHRGGPDRPPRAVDAAHERRTDGHCAPHGDGRRAVPRGERHRLRRRPAARPPALPALQAADGDPRRGAAGQRLPRARRRGGLRARGLRPLRRLGLQGPHRPLRGHDGHGRDPRARHPAGQRGRDRRRGDALGHAPAAPGRAREGQARPHVAGRGRPRHRHGLARLRL